MEVFGRRYSIVVGKPEKWNSLNKSPTVIPAKGEFGSTSYSPNPPSDAQSIDRASIPPVFKEWNDYQFTADIKASTEGRSSSAASATIKIWNLDKEDIAFIQRQFVLLLRAGYDQDIFRRRVNTVPDLIEYRGRELDRPTGSAALPLLFVGDLLKVETEKDGQDTVTTILCTDSAYAFKNIRVSETYNRGVTYREVIEDLIDKASFYGVKKGNIFLPTSVVQEGAEAANAFEAVNTSSPVLLTGNIALRIDTIMPSGYTAYGDLLSTLQEVCDSIGFRSYLCLGRLYVEPRRVASTKPVLEIEDEGMLYYIKKTSEDDTAIEGELPLISSVEVKMPLDARFTVATALRIKNGEYAGVREVSEVSFSLDYEGEAWDTIIKATGK
jgi:hypothetical protein